MTKAESSFLQGDIEDFIASGKQVDVHKVQLEPGVLEYHLEEIDLGDIRVRQVTINKQMQIEWCQPHGWTSFVLSPPQIEGICNHQDHTLLADTLAVLYPGTEQSFKCTSNWRDLEIMVSDAALAEVGRNFCNPKKQENLKLSLSQQQAERLRSACLSAFQDEKLLNQLRVDGEHKRHFRNIVIGELGLVLASESNPLSTSSRTPSQRHLLVRRALELIQKNNPSTLNAAELGNQLGTTQRSLQRAFNEVLGVSPYQYLMLERLNSSRHKLRHGMDDTTIASLAAHSGFPSASDFSRHYKRFYGELPSQTLTGSKDIKPADIK